MNLRNYKNMVLIAKTLLKLPEEVREGVLNSVLFVVFDTWGTVGFLSLPVPPKCKIIEKPYIMINFDSMKKKSESKKMDVIAHEIAHFWLGHHELDLNFWLEHHKTDVKSSNIENDADNLIEEWGFNRAYKNR